MRILPHSGLLRPVAIILSIQLVVLIASFTLTSSESFNPSVKEDAHLTKSADPLNSEVPLDGSEYEYRAIAGRSLFNIQDVINEENARAQGQSQSMQQLPDRDVEYVVSRGDSVAAVWQKNGAPTLGATKALNAVRDAGLSRFTIRSGEPLALKISSAGDIVRLSKRLVDGSTLILSGSSLDGYEASLIKPNIKEVERSVVGTILSSFSASATDQGISYETIDDVVDLFSNRIEFSRAIQPGDSFTITYVEKRCQETGQVLDTGPVMSASFKRGGKLFAAIRHQDRNGSFVYFDEKGQQGGDFFLRYPVKFTRISSTFSWARFHPVLQRSRPHRGVDFAAPSGTPIRSVGDGLVEIAAFKSAPGNMLRIKHSSRWSTVYMHLQRFAPGIKAGQRVARGQVIGYVGTTGLSTGPHLHFELWENGQYVDPMAADLPNISSEGPGLPPGFLTATLQDLEMKHQKVQLAFISSGKHQG